MEIYPKLRRVHFSLKVGQIKILLTRSRRLVIPQLLGKEVQRVKRYIVVQLMA